MVALPGFLARHRLTLLKAMTEKTEALREGRHARFLRAETQFKVRQGLAREVFRVPDGLLRPAKHHEVVGVAHEVPVGFLHPAVERVEVGVGQQGRNARALRQARAAPAHQPPVFAERRFYPSAQEPDQRTFQAPLP